MPKLIDISGQRFGRWLVLAKAGGTQANGALWLCRCDCGIERKVNSRALRGGQSQSCGCFKVEAATRRINDFNRSHGESNSREHRTWMRMRNRCFNSSNRAYQRYGGRGITIDPRWDDYSVFLADMGRCPKGYWLDRIDNNGNYEPSNCGWRSPKEQQNNRSTNRRITYDGTTMTLQQWADRLGICHRTIAARLNSGKSIHQTLTTPVRRRAR